MRIHGMARSRLAESWEAEEIVQEIFCKLWRRRATLSLDKSFEHYFSGAVKFEVINRLAKQARSRRFKNEWAARPAQRGESAAERLDYRSLRQELQRTVDTLPQKSRLVFQLRHENGYTLHQIAHRLGISIKTVEFHLHKARKTIRSLLANLLS